MTEPIVPDSLTDYSDTQLDDLTEVIQEEKARRSSLESIPDRVAELTGEFLAAEGTIPKQSWRQPHGAHDAYPKGWRVQHSGKLWESLTPSNIWPPGQTGWREVTVDGTPPEWVQPRGAHDAYAKGAEVAFEGRVWVSMEMANVWRPGVHGWAQLADVVEEPTPEPEIPVEPTPDPDPVVPETPVIPQWVQPTGGHDAYAAGYVVSHNSKNWKSSNNANVWEPGVFGWDVVQ